MIFEKYSSLLKRYLNKLGYNVEHKANNSFYHLEGYKNNGSNELFQIYEVCKSVRYVEEITDVFWSTVDEYDYESLKHLYCLAKKHAIAAKKQIVKNKLKEIEKDF